MLHDDIDNIFVYHPPVNDQAEKYREIREKTRELAHLINDLCPESREKSLAITHLQSASMFANASIAINTSVPETPEADTADEEQAEDAQG